MAENPPVLKAGDRVGYVPGPDHWHETDARGEYVFAFVHAADGPPLPIGRQDERVRKGDPVREKFGLGERGHEAPLGTVESRDADGTLHTSKGYTLRPVGPKGAWPGTVREEIKTTYREETVSFQGTEIKAQVPSESRSLVLDVVHPNGTLTLHFPLEGLSFDPEGKQPHSYHLPKE